MIRCPACQTAIPPSLVSPLSKVTDTTQEGQENAMLADLKAAGAAGLTTDDFRAAGYYQVSARIWGLRARGAVIHTELYNGLGADGVWHCRMARYRLISDPEGPKTGQEATNGGEAACH